MSLWKVSDLIQNVVNVQTAVDLQISDVRVLRVWDLGTGVCNSMKTLTSAQVWRAQVVPLFSNRRGQERCRNVAQQYCNLLHVERCDFMLCCLTVGHPSREDVPEATRSTLSSRVFACGTVGGGFEVVYGSLSRLAGSRVEPCRWGSLMKIHGFSLCRSVLAALLHTEPNVCCVCSSLETLHTAGAEHLTAISTSHTLACVCVCVRLCVIV